MSTDTASKEVTSNIATTQKIRDRQLASPVEGDNIQDLCRNELKTKKHTATEGLLWLVRYAGSPSLPIVTFLRTLKANLVT